MYGGKTSNYSKSMALGRVWRTQDAAVGSRRVTSLYHLIARLKSSSCRVKRATILWWQLEIRVSSQSWREFHNTVPITSPNAPALLTLYTIRSQSTHVRNKIASMTVLRKKRIRSLWHPSPSEKIDHSFSGLNWEMIPQRKRISTYKLCRRSSTQ